MLSLLLHHHQPDYRDPRTGEPVLPYARLHALRGYRDVATAIRETGARVTVNLVPSLLDQWDHYARGGADPALRVCRLPPEEVDPAWIAPLLTVNPRWYTWFPALAALRGRRLGPAEVRDAQVWAQLAWFGWSAMRDWPELGALRRKGAGFTEDEKRRVLEIQGIILGEMGALHRGLPEVSTSPYFHPILPLLVDTAHARRNLVVPDPGFRAPADALAQLVEGRARTAAYTAGPVTGLWPSEGSVSPEVVALAAEAGFTWFATDEAVLARSEHTPGDHHGAWQVGPLRGVFRDHALSDRVGFVYADWDGAAAAADLVHRAGRRSTLLALDGENPWESYRDAGEAFLLHLFDHPLHPAGELAERTPVGRVRHLHTGSWVNADFRIWIGHEEDRVAWRLLAEARAAWVAAGAPAAGRASLFAAEGSDWFWWYGDDFHTPVAAIFDALFRAHLAAVWRACGLAPPAALARPIKAPVAGVPARGPWREGADWFAWQRRGRQALAQGAMARVGRPRQLSFGRIAGGWRLALHPVEAGWSAEGRPFVDGRCDVRGPSVHLRDPDGEELLLELRDVGEAGGEEVAEEAPGVLVLVDGEVVLVGELTEAGGDL